MIGVNDGLLNLIVRIDHLRSEAMASSSSGSPALTGTIISSAIKLWQDLEAWQPTHPRTIPCIHVLHLRPLHLALLHHLPRQHVQFQSPKRSKTRYCLPLPDQDIWGGSILALSRLHIRHSERESRR
jgi:hypothetical protein